MRSEGRIQPITIISPVRPWWATWLKATWPFARGSRLVTRPLVKLGFINFAHWSLFDRVPASARGGGARRLPQPYILFQSNFNGHASLYIDAFSLVVRGRLWLLWAGAYGYPGARPMERFKCFIMKHQVPAQHYWTAYPEASSRMVVSALAAQRELERFARDAAALPAGEFAAAYERFLTDVQEHL